MLIGKLYEKTKACIKSEISFYNLAQDCFSHLFNLFRFQRRLRRIFFPLNKVIFCLRKDEDLVKYKDFLDKYLFSPKEAGRIDCNLSNEFVTQDRLHFVGKLKEAIIASVHLMKRFTFEGNEFWELSGLVVLKEYQGFGIAERLTKVALAGLGLVSRRVVYLTVEENNFRAKNLYEKLCFKEEDALLKKLIRINSLKEDTTLKMFYGNYC